MRKVVVVAVREYIAAVKSKAFVITIVLMPVLMSLGFIAEAVLKNKVDITTKKLALIDDTGKLFDKIAAAAEKRNNEAIFEKPQSTEPDQGDTRKQILPRFEIVRPDTQGKDRKQVLLDLSENVRNKELFAFAVINSNAFDPPKNGEEKGSAIRYYSNTPTYRDLRRWLERTTNAEVQRWRFSQAGLNRAQVDWALKPLDLDQFSLFEHDPATGEIRPAKKVSGKANFVIAAVLVILMFMVIMIGASPLIQTALEEKTQRIAEVILASVSPFQWMMGKLIGMVGVSFTIVFVYLAGGLILANRYGVLNLVPFELLGWFFAYLALAVLMFGAVFVAAGAACTDHREAQSAIMPVMIFIMIPMMLWVNVAKEPTSTLAVTASLFPPATPILMLVRQAVPPGVPAWQPVLGITLVLLTTVACIFVAGRIFRIGILAQGKGASLKQVIGWVIKG